jgi:hypothetical protein
MRRTVVGAIAVIAAASVITLTGLQTASAAEVLPLPNNQAAASGFSPSYEASTLQTLHDALQSQWQSNDTAGMQTTQRALAAELASLQESLGSAAMAPGAMVAPGQAQQDNAKLGQALNTRQGMHGARHDRYNARQGMHGARHDRYNARHGRYSAHQGRNSAQGSNSAQPGSNSAQPGSNSAQPGSNSVAASAAPTPGLTQILQQLLQAVLQLVSTLLGGAPAPSAATLQVG